MRIERLHVEEGFLDGLRLDFSPGLNILIGARGVGKTSVLELIRYCLRLPHVDQRRAAIGDAHAEGVLGGGRVSVTFETDGLRRTLSRSESDPKVVDAYTLGKRRPLVLGQNELEGIGLDARSRLQLIDSLAPVSVGALRAETEVLRAEVRSLTSQLRGLDDQRESLRQESMVRASVVEELESARALEAELLSRASVEASEIRKSLAVIDSQAAQNQRDLAAIDAGRNGLGEISSTATRLEGALRVVVTDLVSVVQLDSLDSPLRDALTSSAEFTQTLQKLSDAIDQQAVMIRQRLSELDNKARPLRIEFGKFEEGAGAAAQRTATLERQLASIDAAQDRLSVLDNRSGEVGRRRGELLDQLDAIAEEVWSVRSTVARELDKKFSPGIRVHLEHFGDRSSYIADLANALRGSGLQFNQVADWIADRVSPAELVAAVEVGDAARLSIMAELTSARVEKLLAHLRSSEHLGAILTSTIDDSATVDLLVGRDYKATDQLSTGQRFAAILNLLLADSDRLLLLDQPEDHLDNAYLVENTIRSLLSRGLNSQTIVATHNANVPVLGEASLIAVLRSDGRRGFVDRVGPLHRLDIIQAITDLMEGGAQAFKQRAKFYASRPTS